MNLHSVRERRRAAALLAVATLGVDQGSKLAAPHLGLHPVRNDALMLGLGGHALALGIAVLAAGTMLLARALDGGRVAPWAVAATIGGASANLVDRVRLGYVVDFIPAPGLVFNLADVAV